MALQLNIKIEKCEGMEYVFKDLPTVYFPIIWFETSFEIPDMIAGALRLLINIPTIMRVASVFGIVAGLVGIYLIYRQVSRRSLKPNVQKMKLKNLGHHQLLSKISKLRDFNKPLTHISGQ